MGSSSLFQHSSASFELERNDQGKTPSSFVFSPFRVFVMTTSRVQLRHCTLLVDGLWRKDPIGELLGSSLKDAGSWLSEAINL